MVTDSTQKLYCVNEVFWGQLPPLSEGSSTSRPLKGKREATGPCDRGPIQRTRTVPFPGVHPGSQGSARVFLVEEANVSGRCVAWLLSLGLSVWKP